MLNPDLILDTQTYSLITSRPLSSVRSDASQPISEPNTLTISHENANSGKRSTAVIFDDTKVVATVGEIPTVDNVRIMLKLQFNPFSGRTTTAADIGQLLTELSAFIAVPENITKILNSES